jgi:hypothetical protein
MENLQIKIVVTDGTKEAKASVDVNMYKMMKEMHGVSMVEEFVEELLKEMEKSV